MVKRLFLALIATCTIGCFSNASSAAPVKSSPKSELVLWHTQDGPHALLFKELIDSWSKKSGVAVRLETGMQLAETLLTTKVLPDAVMAPSDLTTHCPTIKCSLVQISEMDPDSNVIDADSIATVTTRAGINAVPLFYGNQLLLFYNRKLVKEPVTDLKKLLADPRPISPSLAFDIQSPYVLAAFIAGFSGHSVARGDLKPTRTAMLKSFQVYRDLIDSSLVPKVCDHKCVGGDFFKGKYPYAINGDWAVLEARSQLGKDLGLAPLPSWDGKPLVSLKASHALFFPANSWNGPKKTALRSLTTWLLSAEAQQKFNVVGWRFPVRKLKQESWPNDQRLQRSVLLQSAQTALPLTPHENTAMMWAILRHGLRLIVESKATPESAIDAVFTFGNLKEPEKK